MSELMFHGVMTLFAITILFALFVGPWQTLVVDVVRQRAFEIRDRAFLWSVDNGRLDDGLSLEFRDAINHSIRYFEEMSLMKIVTLAFLHNRQKDGTQKREKFGFMSDQHFSHEFNIFTGTIVIGLVLRSSIGLFLSMLLLPLAMLAYIVNGKAKSRTKGIASRVRREVQTDLLLAF